MRILFGIMSAVQPADTVASLVDALGERHPILIHHDWSQQPSFELRRPQVSFVEHPMRTGWANWGFSQGILKLVDSALKTHDFDYFQLLSPTCMPIRPVELFERYLEDSAADFHVDAADVGGDRSALMSHGWRAYSAENTLRHRVLRRSRRWFLGEKPTMANRAGLSFPVTSLLEKGGLAAFKAKVGWGITLLAEGKIGFDHAFSAEFRCYAGSTWFAASRKGCEYLMKKAQDEALMGYFARMHMGDEIFFPSVFMNSGLKCVSASHDVAKFIDARPSWLEAADLDHVIASGKFFARKFPEDSSDEVRLRLLDSLREQRSSLRTSVGRPVAA